MPARDLIDKNGNAEAAVNGGAGSVDRGLALAVPTDQNSCYWRRPNENGILRATPLTNFAAAPGAPSVL
jgi:hypothetical protein